MPTWSILREQAGRASAIVGNCKRLQRAYPGAPVHTPDVRCRWRWLAVAATAPGGTLMAGSVIVNGARTPMGRLLGSLKDFSGADLGGVAIKAALERSGVAPDQVQYVIMGQVLQAGAGQIPARQAAHKAGIPLQRPGADDQQGLPVRPGRDRAGRPADPRRRVRHHRGRRPGVDDQRAAPAAEVARGLQVRRRSRCSTRWPTTASPTSSTTSRWASRPTTSTRARPDPRGAGRVRRALAPARRDRAEERRVRRRDHAGARSRSARATRSSSARTRASAPTPPSSRWPSCVRRSPRTAPSPPAPPRRSPTALPRSSS